MRCLLPLALLASTAVAAHGADSRAYQPFTVPWGMGAGAVARGASPGAELTGPAAIRAGASGELLVVDTLGARVLIFAPSGQLLRALSLPPDAHDAQRAPVDVAQDAAGDFYVLERAERALFRFAPDGALRNPIPIPTTAGSPAILTAAGVDADDRLLVFDGFDNSVLRFDRAGKPLPPVKHELVQGLTLSGRRYLGLELSSRSTQAFKLWSFDPVSSTCALAGEVKLAEPAAEIALLGADRAGRIYVEIANGATEHPTDHQVIVLTPDARILQRLPIPPPPTSWGMLRARTVLPDGGVVTASDTPEGLVLRPHMLGEAR